MKLRMLVSDARE